MAVMYMCVYMVGGCAQTPEKAMFCPVPPYSNDRETLPDLTFAIYLGWPSSSRDTPDSGLVFQVWAVVSVLLEWVLVTPSGLHAYTACTPTNWGTSTIPLLIFSDSPVHGSPAGFFIYHFCFVFFSPTTPTVPANIIVTWSTGWFSLCIHSLACLDFHLCPWCLSFY